MERGKVRISVEVFQEYSIDAAHRLRTRLQPALSRIVVQETCTCCCIYTG